MARTAMFSKVISMARRDIDGFKLETCAMRTGHENDLM
jgi:hypothetical protein